MTRLSYKKIGSEYHTGPLVFFDAVVYGIVFKKGYRIIYSNGELLGRAEADSLRSAKKQLKEHLVTMGIRFFDEVRNK